MDFQIVSSQPPVENGDFAAVCVVHAFSELTLCVEEIKQPKKVVGWSSCCVDYNADVKLCLITLFLKISFLKVKQNSHPPENFRAVS